MTTLKGTLHWANFGSRSDLIISVENGDLSAAGVVGDIDALSELFNANGISCGWGDYVGTRCRIFNVPQVDAAKVLRIMQDHYNHYKLTDHKVVWQIV